MRTHAENFHQGRKCSCPDKDEPPDLIYKRFRSYKTDVEKDAYLHGLFDAKNEMKYERKV